MSQQVEAEEHGLKPGDRVTVLTIDYPIGLRRRLYLYDTGASFMASGLDLDGTKYSISSEPWDGVERVSFYNGD